MRRDADEVTKLDFSIQHPSDKERKKKEKEKKKEGVGGAGKGSVWGGGGKRKNERKESTKGFQQIDFLHLWAQMSHACWLKCFNKSTFNSETPETFTFRQKSRQTPQGKKSFQRKSNTARACRSRSARQDPVRHRYTGERTPCF